MPEYTSEQPAGRRLGRYVVRRRIGAGGFARVYLGWDPDLEIEVAIKIPKPQLAEDEGALERFRREATTAARLRHPNVVTVLTVGRIEDRFDGVPTDTPYLVMDYLPESLAGRLAITPALPEAEWLEIGAQVGRGLAYAHARSVIHRDIKPDNILFGRHGEAVLTDFGIARAVVEGMSAESRSVVVGTPEYFSPEQARGMPFDARTDIYGLGVTLFRAATGVLPFTGVDWYAIMRQHVEDAPPSPRALNPALSHEAEAMLLRCLAKSPADRYQSVDELLADIEIARRRAAIQEGMGIGATAELPWRQTPPAPTRRRAWWLVSLFPVAGVIGASAWLLAQDAAAARRRDEIGIRQPPPVSVAAPAAPVPDTTAVPSAPTPHVATESTAVRTRTTRASLVVSAPTGAALYVNGERVGTTSWRSDTLIGGTYFVRAVLTSTPDCPSAVAASSIDLRAGAQERTSLAPVPCGALSLTDVRPLPAHYSLRGAVQRDGSLPLGQPLYLPVGVYYLTITKAYCVSFSDTLRITASGPPIRPRLVLMC